MIHEILHQTHASACSPEIEMGFKGIINEIYRGYICLCFSNILPMYVLLVSFYISIFQGIPSVSVVVGSKIFCYYSANVSKLIML